MECQALFPRQMHRSTTCAGPQLSWKSGENRVQQGLDIGLVDGARIRRSGA
jgi:hypothetical protein